MKKRLGRITASELGSITSASGKIIDGVVSYIRSKRFERNHGYALPVSSHTMDVGNETEPTIFEWLKANCPDGIDPSALVYSKNEPEIPFWVSEACPMGASPDCFTKDGATVFEFKTLVGNEATEFFCDPHTSYEEKMFRVVKEHMEQLLGLFLSNPDVERIYLIKYTPQRDDIMADIDDPLVPWRGIVFKFDRAAYKESIEEMRQRIILINAMIDAPINPSEFKKGEWIVLEDGQLLKK